MKKEKIKSVKELPTLQNIVISGASLKNWYSDKENIQESQLLCNYDSELLPCLKDGVQVTVPKNMVP